MKYKVNGVFFSATGTTKKVVSKLAKDLAENLKSDTYFHDFTQPLNREKSLKFNDKDIVIVGLPVYAGRVPNVLINYLNTIKSDGAKAVAVVLFGNRDYDDALIELKNILKANGFKVIAGGAFVGEHSFSTTLAQGRPDKMDLEKVSRFANQIHSKISSGSGQEVVVPGNESYRPYYKPKDDKGEDVDFRKIKPKTNEDCTDCKLCVSLCPMGSIDYDDVSKLNYICIKCGACIKNCPVNAKYYDDEDYLRHKYELEIELTERKEPEIFL
ncbi:MAG: 4Fe-4S binding protein [Tissierellia bacterium]|nr:4Fe-4S binding protein [Tissierellia bacterium]